MIFRYNVCIYIYMYVGRERERERDDNWMACQEQRQMREVGVAPRLANGFHNERPKNHVKFINIHKHNHQKWRNWWESWDEMGYPKTVALWFLYVSSENPRFWSVSPAKAETEQPKGFKCGTFGASSIEDRHLATGDYVGGLAIWDLENMKKPIWSRDLSMLRKISEN